MHGRTSSRIAAALLVAALLSLAGCAGPSSPAPTPVPIPAAPAAADLSTPEAAVHSYLAWTTYGYHVADSDVATPTMSPDEEVRVNSYVEFNREKGRVIDQHLESMVFGKSSIEGTRAVLRARERWVYQYLAISDQKPLSPQYQVTYDTTYTVVAVAPGRWTVDHVEVKSPGSVK